MPKPTPRSGNWQVVRDCCQSGNCAECHDLKVGERKTIVQATGYSEEYARWIARNWSSYEARAERMP